MKNKFRILMLLFAAALFTIHATAQSSTRPWLVNLGFNAIDFHGPDSTGDIFKPRFWNTVPAFSHIGLARCLNPSWAVDLQLLGSQITKGPTGTKTPEKGFYAGDVDLRYKFDNGYLLKENACVAPYLFGGAGLTYMEKDKTRPNYGGGLGINFWVSDNFGLYAQGGYRGSTDSHDYFQWSAGLVFGFGEKDSDNDGIPDDADACPNDPGPAATKGCPDKDGDLVPDKSDACPDVAGLIALNGCPDSDGDGIADKDDACPNDKGSIELRGCPDKDGDGVADKDDRCPDQKGLKELQGCPDSDGDGIADKDDECPTLKGTAALHGCPDRDNDGVPDNKDRCPDLAGPASNGGCPVPKAEEIEKINIAAKAIQYQTGSDKIQSKSFAVLDEIVSVMKEYPDTKWDIEGHTDNVGKADKNLDLSNRRAASVKNYFVSKGITAERLLSQGFGDTRPIADNKTADGRAQNRRTEIHLVNQQ